VDSPYVYLIRDPADHAPYNQFDWEKFTRQQTSREYFDSVSSIQQMRDDYQNAVSGSIDRFQNLIQQAKEYDTYEKTLFVYLGDHGERVGEYGYVGHNHLARPESVYVPTLFYHKDIDPGRRDGCIRHIDIAPTVCELLGIKTKKMDGNSIKIGEEVYRPGYNQYESVFYTSTRLDSRRTVQSYWDHDGGFVKTKGGYSKALIIYGYLRWNMSPNRFIGGDGFRSTFSKFSPGIKKYGNPSISLEKSEKIFEQFQKRQNTGEEKVDQETIDQLESLGYM
jgi:arylsulfatase A-like enzyme